MIYTLGGIIIAFITIWNYKKGFLLFLLFQMIWFPDTQVVQIGGLSLNINFLMSTMYVLLFLIKSKGKIRCTGGKFPYTVPMMCITFSLFITCFTSLSGFFSEFAKAIGLVMMDILMVYLIWKYVCDKSDFAFLFKGLTIILFISCIYCLLEGVVHINPVLNYKISCSSNSLSVYADYFYGYGRGYRCYSIFEHPICASMIYALYVALVLNMIMNSKKIPYKHLTIITMLLSVICVFFTKQRAGMFLLAISVLPCINFKKKKFYKLALLAVICVLFILPFIWDYLFVLLSSFIPNMDNGSGGVVGGSTSSMRLMQLNAVYHIMLQSPIAGLGENFKRLYSSVYAAQALDFESLWFEQMAKHGILGVLAYIVMIYYSVYKIPKHFRSKQVFYLSLAYWATYTLTSTPYFRIYFLYAVIFYFIKNSEAYTTMQSGQSLIKNNRCGFYTTDDFWIRGSNT